MEFLDLKEDELKSLVESNEKVMVQFGASWCGNCRLLKPKFKKMAAKNEDVLFTYVDAEKLPQSRGMASVENLPTFASYKDGKLVAQRSGSKAEIIQEILDEITSN